MNPRIHVDASLRKQATLIQSQARETYETFISHCGYQFHMTEL